MEELVDLKLTVRGTGRVYCLDYVTGELKYDYVNRGEPVFDQQEFDDMVSKGTEAWKNLPANWLEDLRGV